MMQRELEGPQMGLSGGNQDHGRKRQLARAAASGDVIGVRKKGKNYLVIPFFPPSIFQWLMPEGKRPGRVVP